MKQIYTLSFALLLAFTSFAQTRPVNIATTWYGDWGTASNWSLNREPQDGDSIIISGGRGIVVDKPYNLKNVYIKVIGNNSYIHLKGKLNLDDASFLEVGMGSRIMAFGANRNSETISIGGVKKFDQNSNSNMYGFGIASKFTGTSPNGFTTDIVQALPVVFTSFYAKVQGNYIVLNWGTAQEKDNSHFEIEKSADGRNWKNIAVVFGNGTTNDAHNYSYTDRSENGTAVYYRIRQVDIDGNAIYSTVKSIRSGEAKSDAHIFAASKNTINVDLNSNSKTNLQVVVVNMSGQVIAKQLYSNASYRVSIQVPQVTTGMYLVQVSDGNGWNESRKIIL